MFNLLDIFNKFLMRCSYCAIMYSQIGNCKKIICIEREMMKNVHNKQETTIDKRREWTRYERNSRLLSPNESIDIMYNTFPAYHIRPE